MTRRAVILGLLVVAAIAVATPYSDLVMQGTWIGLTAFPVSAFFALFIFVVPVNWLLRRLGTGLSAGELLVVYCLALVGAGIPSFGLTGLLIPYMAGPFYFASPENRWEETLWPNIAEWLHPPAGPVTRGLYEGIRPGTPVPWGDWVGPLLAWGALVLSVYVVFFALAALLRRRWVDDEKLVFPLMQLPLELTRYEDQHALPTLLRNPVMWTFLAVPFLIHAVNGLSYYVPGLPPINVHRIALDSYLTDRPWNAMSPLWLRFLFSIIGLGYILPAELSFSLWFFLLFFLVQQVIGSALGMPMPAVQAYPVKRFIAHQMIGGIFSYFVIGMLAARPNLSAVWRSLTGHAERKQPAPLQDDSREPLPYSLAAWAALAGLAVTCIWGSVAGAGAFKVLVLMALFYALHIIAVRLVCEGGMLYVQHPFRPLNVMLAAMGSRAIGAKSLAVMGLLDHLFMLDNRSPLMPGLVQSLKVADESRINPRSLMRAMAGAVLLSMALSCYAYLRLMYTHGGTALNTWFTTYYTNNLYSRWANHLIVDGEPATLEAFPVMAIGAACMWGLTMMHRTHLWWPLHPIGYLMGASWPMINFWFPIMLGWIVKTTVLRFGGHKVYRRLLPGFLGLILGEFLSAGVWVIVDLFTGVRGHEIFSF